MATQEAPRMRSAVRRVVARRDAARAANLYRHEEVAKMQQEKDEREQTARDKADAKNPKCDMCGKAL